MSALVGLAICTGARPCYERLVIELAVRPDAIASADVQGYSVTYTRSPVTDIRGANSLASMLHPYTVFTLDAAARLVVDLLMD